ncbi:MAG: carbohydrate kinase family protein, partial [Bacteroidota bacterium]
VLGRVGRDALGDLIVTRLAQAGVDARWVKQSAELVTGLGVALCTDDDRAILTYPGSLAALEPADLTDEILSSARHLHIGSYFLQSGLRPAMPGILRRARTLGLSISLDPNWDPAEEWQGLDEILPMVDLFLPNETELVALTGCADIEAGLRRLAEQVPVVAVKRGARGAVACKEGTLHTCPPLAVDPVDAVGAGDCFDAGVVHGFLNGATVADMLRQGCICGAHSLTRRGGILGQTDRAGMAALLESGKAWRIP